MKNGFVKDKLMDLGWTYVGLHEWMWCMDNYDAFGLL